MRNRLNNKRINGFALEQIMRDVLQGMQDFTHGSCRNSHAEGLRVIAVEKGRSTSRRTAAVIPFPAGKEPK